MYYALCVTLPIGRLHAVVAFMNSVHTQAKIKWMSDETVLGLRLAPDMLPLVKQIQILSDTAKGTASRLGSKEAPSFEDTETTIGEIQTRLERTIAFLETFTNDDFTNASTREARFPYFPGMHMVGEDYLIGYAIPNFLFHVTTAYDILRHHSFELGKKDFMHTLPLIPDVV